MKNLLKLVLLTLLFSSCTTNRYALNNSIKEDKNFLITEIKKAKAEGKISSNKPVIVIDGIPHRFNYELKEKKLDLFRENIEEISILKKDVGIRIYGEFAKGGVLVVTTKPEIDKTIDVTKKAKPAEDANILFFVNGKEMSKDVVLKMDPNSINTLTVIKDKEEIKKYTDKIYDGVIIIELKK